MNEEKTTTQSLTVGTRIAYGCGDTACNIVFGMISTLLTLFYTDYAGITSAVISSLLDKAGYISSTGLGVIQPTTAIHMIQNIYIWGPILVWGVAVIALILYRLDKLYPKIMEELSERESRGEL